MIYFTFETERQFLARMTTHIVREYNCSLEDAEYCAPAHLPTWREDTEEALIAGFVPSQAWINSVQATPPFKFGWWESFIHAHPDVFDRLHYAGRSLLVPKSHLNASVNI